MTARRACRNWSIIAKTVSSKARPWGGVDRQRSIVVLDHEIPDRVTVLTFQINIARQQVDQLIVDESGRTGIIQSLPEGVRS